VDGGSGCGTRRREIRGSGEADRRFDRLHRDRLRYSPAGASPDRIGAAAGSRRAVERGGGTYGYLHWASDVVFGAAPGMTTARTVTIYLRKAAISLAPMALPGGGVLVNMR